MPKHGTFYGYTSGCRCKSCCKANTEHGRLRVGAGQFGIKVGARWAAISVDFLHPNSMQRWRNA